MDQRLKSLSAKKDQLSSVLFVQDGEWLSRTERLMSWAGSIEGQNVSEAKGTLLLLSPKDDNLQDNIKVEDVRELLSKLSLRLWDPSKRRYVLLPYAEKLTTSSSNALLKILEEPPESTIFLLMASSRRQMLDTVLSRSLVVNMSSLTKKNLDLHENAFYRAFFKNNSDSLKALKKDQIQTEWAQFYSEALELFRLEKVQDPASFFETLNGIEQRLQVHMDAKWISSYISRSLNV